MEKQKVCLTGATGHVGYAILKELQNHEEKDVRIILRREPDYIEGMRCEKFKGDITDYESLLRAFEGCDIVYHVAGCVEIKPGNDDFVYNINVNGTNNVIRACRKAKVKRLVYMSSVDTYVPAPDGEVMKETYHYDPDELEGTYAKTKAEATRNVLAANGRDGLETVVCQPSACMGPYDFKVSSVGSMIRMFSTGRFPITMTFGGYNFVDVRDVALGTIAAGDVPCAAGQVYLLCNESCTVDEFIRKLAEVSGHKPPRIRLGKGIIDVAAPAMEVYYKAAQQTPLFTRYAVRKLCSNCNFSYEKAHRELGYTPRPLEESLRDTLAWIAENEANEKEKARLKKEAAEAAAKAEKEAAEAAEQAEKEAATAEQAEAAEESVEGKPEENAEPKEKFTDSIMNRFRLLRNRGRKTKIDEAAQDEQPAEEAGPEADGSEQAKDA